MTTYVGMKIYVNKFWPEHQKIVRCQLQISAALSLVSIGLKARWAWVGLDALEKRNNFAHAGIIHLACSQKHIAVQTELSRLENRDMFQTSSTEALGAMNMIPQGAISDRRTPVTNQTNLCGQISKE
jgi:hypothetical protein